MNETKLIELIIEYLDEQIETMKDRDIDWTYQSAIDSLILTICEHLDDETY